MIEVINVVGVCVRNQQRGLAGLESRVGNPFALVER